MFCLRSVSFNGISKQIELCSVARSFQMYLGGIGTKYWPEMG